VLEQMRERWRAREAATSIHDVMDFGPDGLVLGAGTVLAQRKAVSPAPNGDDEARLLTLLSVAYARPVPAQVLKHIQRATLRWDEGQATLARVHLAMTQLNRLPAPREAARRLFMADELMKAGMAPADILSSMDIDASAVLPDMEKYSPSQPRVPKGSGRPSGQWVHDALAAAGAKATVVGREIGAAERAMVTEIGREAAIAGRAAGAVAEGAAAADRAVASGSRQAAGLVTSLSPAELGELALMAGRLGGPAAFLGVAFFPSTIGRNAEGAVPGAPGWRYASHADDLYMRFTYDGPNGQHQTFLAHRDTDGVLRDPQNRTVGKVLPDGRTAIQLRAVSLGLVNDQEPNYCPAPTPDNPGSVRGRNYEDFVKRYVNPDRPTPRGLAIALMNPVTGKEVKYDDCQHETGIMIDAKGPEYDWLLSQQLSNPNWKPRVKLLKQALEQFQASHGRPIVWYLQNPARPRKQRRFFQPTEKDEKV